MSDGPNPLLHFVCCVSNEEVFAKRLAASPCLRTGRWGLSVHRNAASAAQGFNATLQELQGCGVRWLVWVHQDVLLPQDWDTQWLQSLADAQRALDGLAVVGVYGLRGAGPAAVRAGCVLDRGVLLREPAPLPCEVDSLDELLFGVRVDSGLSLDPELGFDFYATDVVMQAKALGLRSAVVEAFCEHWSDSPQFGEMPQSLVQRVLRNGAAFERKWAQSLPVTTPCFDISAPGDVARAVATVYTPS